MGPSSICAPIANFCREFLKSLSRSLVAIEIIPFSSGELTIEKCFVEFAILTEVYCPGLKVKGSEVVKVTCRVPSAISFLSMILAFMRDRMRDYCAIV